MRDLYKILSKLEEKGIDHNFQVLHFPAGAKYNLRVDDIYKKTHYLHGYTFDEIEAKLKMIWGSLIVPQGMPMP